MNKKKKKKKRLLRALGGGLVLGASVTQRGRRSGRSLDEPPLPQARRSATAGDMLKAVRWSAGSASLGLLSLTIYAVNNNDKKENHTVVVTDDLSLYSVPSHASRFVEEPRSSLEEGISRMRRAAQPYTAALRAAYDRSRPSVDVAIHERAEHYLRPPPPETLKSLAVIGLSGVLGFLLARSSRLKKLLYPAGLVGLTSALYYPRDTLEAALIGGKKLCDWSVALCRLLRGAWRKVLGQDAAAGPPGPPGPPARPG